MRLGQPFLPGVTCMKTVYVGSDNKVALACPGCEKAKVVDVSKYLKSSGSVNLTYRFRCDDCECGHKDCNECLHNECSQGYVNTVKLERRVHIRKDTMLPGKLTLNSDDHLPVQVLDLSRTGARIRVSSPITVKLGQKVIIDFQLDDRKKTAIQKEGKVVRGKGSVAALAFSEIETYSTADKAIGFYLMK